MKWGKSATAQCVKMQAVTTLCRFQCGVAGACALRLVEPVFLPLPLTRRMLRNTGVSSVQPLSCRSHTGQQLTSAAINGLCIRDATSLYTM